MTLATIVEQFMHIAGNLDWNDKRTDILDGWLNDILPEGWGDMQSVTLDDGSVWAVWYW